MALVPGGIGAGLSHPELVTGDATMGSTGCCLTVVAATVGWKEAQLVVRNINKKAAIPIIVKHERFFNLAFGVGSDVLSIT